MQRTWVLALVAAVLIASCSPAPSPASKAPPDKETKPAGAPAEGGPAAPQQAAAPKEVEINAGDVEYAVSIEADVAPESQTPNVTVEKLSSETTKRATMLTLTLTPPPPQQLWVIYRVKSQQAFPSTPVVLRVKVIAEIPSGGGGQSRKELGSFSCVIGKRGQREVFEKKVDILAGIERLPETFLVRTKSEALLMPVGADEATLNPDTATTTPERCTEAIKGCPIRVNVKPAGGTS